MADLYKLLETIISITQPLEESFFTLIEEISPRGNPSNQKNTRITISLLAAHNEIYDVADILYPDPNVPYRYSDGTPNTEAIEHYLTQGLRRAIFRKKHTIKLIESYGFSLNPN